MISDKKKFIEDFRVKAQKVTVSVAEDTARDVSATDEVALQRLISMVENGELDKAKEEARDRNADFRSDLVYELISMGKYEECRSFLSVEEDAEHPDIGFLRLYVSYLLGDGLKELATSLEQNVEKYTQLLPARRSAAKDEKVLRRSAAKHLQLWGVLLAQQGRHSDAAEKYQRSLDVEVLPGTLYNRFCLENRTGDAGSAYNTLKELMQLVPPKGWLAEKLQHDSAILFRNEDWFKSAMEEYLSTSRGSDSEEGQ